MYVCVCVCVCACVCVCVCVLPTTEKECLVNFLFRFTCFSDKEN